MLPNDPGRRLLAAAPTGRERTPSGPSPPHAEPAGQEALRLDAARLRQEIIDATASQFTIPAPLARRLGRAHARLDALLGSPAEEASARSAVEEAAAALAALAELGWVRTRIAPTETQLPVAKPPSPGKSPKRPRRRK